MKILNVLWQSGQLASLAWSTSDGFAVEVGKGSFCRWNDDTADKVDDGNAFRAISLFSTRAMTSFTGLVRRSFVPRMSRRMSGSDSPLRMTSRMTWFV